MFQSLRDARPAVADVLDSPAGEPAVVRPVFVDVRGHRRVWMRISAAALAVVAVAFITGAGLLLSERPFTAFPRFPGIAEPEKDEAVAGNGTAADAPEVTSTPGRVGGLPLATRAGSSTAQPGALPEPSSPPGMFGSPVTPAGQAAPGGGVQAGSGTPAPDDVVTPRIDLSTDPPAPTTSAPPVVPDPTVVPEPPIVTEPPVVTDPPVDPPPVDPVLIVVSAPPLPDPSVGP